jgi:hypothetical protein
MQRRTMIGFFAVAMAMVLSAGCIYPHKVTLAGPILSKDALAFLDLKDATRAETVATLGSPNCESTNARVLLYFSQTAIHWSGMNVEPNFPDHPEHLTPVRVSEDHDEKLWALFVAYNEEGLVTSHAVQKLWLHHDESCETLCDRYAQGRGKH